MDIEQFFHLIDNGFHFGHSTVLYRLNRLRVVGMFDRSQRRRHDSDLWIRMIADQTWTYDTVNRSATVAVAGLSANGLIRLSTSGGRAHADEHCALIRELAWQHLLSKCRIFYRCVSIWPGLARD